MAKPAPQFKLPDQNGDMHSLQDYHGRWLVVYFYPQDNALGCTEEACTFRDEYRIIQQFGNAAVLGINRGSVSSHLKFANRHHLNFPILSDSGHLVTAAFGAWRSGKTKLIDKPFGTRRNTYLIDPAGNIVRKYIGLDPADHVTRVIHDLQKLQAKQSVI